MVTHKDDLRAFLRNRPHVVLVKVKDIKGSTPRNDGAWMLVSPDAIFRTIGGGQLEYMAIAEARELIATSLKKSLTSDNKSAGFAEMDVPLGPEIGQCCGGRVQLECAILNPAMRGALIAQYDIELAERPPVYIFGAGHIGKVLAEILAHAPLQVVLVDSRENELSSLCTTGIETCLTPLPEEVVRSAPKGSSFVILTHSHALDFLIAKEALERNDAAYVGMIGSKTKLASFKSWLKQETNSQSLAQKLICPIGGTEVKDKRPAVIATLVAAELLTAALNYQSENSTSPLHAE